MATAYRVSSSLARRRIPEKVIHLVHDYIERLERERNTPIEHAILYGSQVRGGMHKWSDIDLCVVSPRFKHPMDAMAFLLQQRNKKEVLALLSPIGFNSKDFEEGSLFIDEIKRTGVDLTIRK